MAAAKAERYDLWWALATVLGALAMGLSAVGGGGSTQEAGADAAVGPVRSVLLMAAIVCLPLALAALMGGLGVMLSIRTRHLARPLLRYAAIVGATAAALLLLVTMPIG